MRKIAVLIASLFMATAASADPVVVMKSRVKPTFATDVDAYAKDLRDWKSHMAKVEADKAAGVPKEKAFSAYPPPSADPTVMGAVDGSGNADFIIVDDDPTPDEVLAGKKALLIQNVRLTEQANLAKLLPDGKRRMFDIRQSAIAAADQAKAAKLLAAQPVGPLSSIGIGAKKDPAKAEADAVAARSPEDAAFMAAQEARREKIEAIAKVAAQAESDIEDLTSENVDAWQMPLFPN